MFVKWDENIKYSSHLNDFKQFVTIDKMCRKIFCTFTIDMYLRLSLYLKHEINII